MNWIIEWMKTTPSTATPPEFVIECGWRCSATEGEFSGTVYATCSFTQGAEADGTFTPYADLTQDQVLGWCWSSGVDKDATEAAVQAQIDNQKNPPVIQPPLPWGAAVPVEVKFSPQPVVVEDVPAPAPEPVEEVPAPAPAPAPVTNSKIIR